MQTFFLFAQRSTVVVCVTQVVGHWDETEASDVSVIASLVELFLGCVITGEPLCRFCQGRKKSVSRILWLESISGECFYVYSPTCGDLKGPSFSCFSNSASEVLVIISWNPKVKQCPISLAGYQFVSITPYILALKGTTYLKRLSGSH